MPRWRARGRRARPRRRGAHDQAYVRAVGVDVHERVDMQDRVCKRADLVGGHRPHADAQQHDQLRAERNQPQPPHGDGATRRGAFTTTSTAWGCSSDDRRASGGADSVEGRILEARLYVFAQLAGVVGEAQQIEVGHRAGVQAGVPDGQAVGDDRRAGRLRLQAGDPAGGVHERVGGRQQLGHLVGEPVDVDARLAREGGGEPLVQLLIAPGEADDAGDLADAAELATAPSTSPTPQPPPETTTMRPSSGSPSVRRDSSGQRGWRNSAEISGATRRAEPCPAIRSTEGIDSPYMTRCMSIPGCAQKKRPVRSVIVATVGQRTRRCGAGARAPR